MQKLYRLVQAITLAVLLITQHSLQAQNCCLDCQADVKVITNNKVLLEKIDLKEGTSTTLNTNLYVSYRSGNAQKFWANVAIATAGVAVSTQLNSSLIVAGDSKSQSSISPIVPLGVSVATLPSIWKNRPRGVPNASIEIQHKDVEGNVLKTWTQDISKAARNDAELLNIALSEPLKKGTVEISLVNGSKNSVYYWGYEANTQVTEKPKKSVFKTPDILALMNDESKDKKVTLNASKDGSLFALSYQLPSKNDVVASVLKTPKTPIWITNTGDCGVENDAPADGAEPAPCVERGELNEVVVSAPRSGGGGSGSGGYGGFSPAGVGNYSGGDYGSSGGGNGGNNSEALEIRKRECLLASNKFNNDVSWARFIREESKFDCVNALGLSDWDTFSVLVALAEGASAVGLFMEASGIFNKLDGMWSCRTAADQQYNWDIESAFNNYQNSQNRFDCAHLY